MRKLRLLFTLLLVVWAVQAQSRSERVAAVLDDWHQAASVADEARYFGHFTPDGVFMGTAATERWTVSEFRVWARPYFAKGKAWNFKPRDRHVAFSEDGKVAWFDEMLDTANLGVCRGSGVLTMVGSVWKISQYNLSVPIPNSLVDGIVKQIAGAGK
jgi:hypothetical protein